MLDITGAELIQKLRSLELPTDDFAIFGSGPMYPRGIKELGHDIDLVARGRAWEKAKSFGNPVATRLNSKNQVISLFNDQIEIFNGWAPGTWDIDNLIDTADIFEGLRYVNLDNLLKWKREMGRPKDFEHIKLIEEYLRNQNH